MSSPEAARDDAGARPKLRLVLGQIMSKDNAGGMIRSASAFGCEEVVVFGMKSFKRAHGSQGAIKHLPLRFFDTLSEARDYLHSVGSELLGLEIDPEAVSVTRPEEAWRGDTAILCGNEGRGLSPELIALCDRTIYIPQHGGGTESLNVHVATAIALHRFADWARYSEAERDGAKYVKAALPTPEEMRNGDRAKEIAREREAKRERARVEDPVDFDPFEQDGNA